jgi:hypothetical protein
VALDLTKFLKDLGKALAVIGAIIAAARAALEAGD